MTSTALTIVHKYIRRDLFQLSLQLSCAGPGDGAAVAAAVSELAQLLRGHAAREDASLEPMLARVDGALAARMREEHRIHDEHLERICSHATAAARNRDFDERDRLQLYLEVNRFIGAYLQHLDDEERILVPAIGLDALPIEEVAQSAAGQPLEQRNAYLQKLWPVLAPHEREAIENALPR